jgi:hypothetical protein
MLPSDSEPSMGKIITPQDGLLYTYLNEYLKLKDEQIARMRFRDNLLYVTLAAFGGIVSYAVTDPSRYYAFLVLPWVSFILGWTYLVNDEKISAIGRYLRYELSDKLEKLIAVDKGLLLGWEVAHRSDKGRVSRKVFQLIVDETTFFISGLVALGAFWLLALKELTFPSLGIQLLSMVEVLFLLSLGFWIFKYADLKKGR